MIPIDADTAAVAIRRAADDAGESIIDCWVYRPGQAGTLAIITVTQALALLGGEGTHIAWNTGGPVGFDLRIVGTPGTAYYLPVPGPGPDTAAAVAALTGGGAKATAGGGHLAAVMPGDDG